MNDKIAQLLCSAPRAFDVTVNGARMEGYCSADCFTQFDATDWVDQVAARGDLAHNEKLFCGIIDPIDLSLPSQDRWPGGIRFYFVEDVPNDVITTVAELGIAPGEPWSEAVRTVNEVRKSASRYLGYEAETIPGLSRDEERGIMRRFIERVDKRHPFRISYIDSKGLIAYFNAAMDMEAAVRLTHEIVLVNYEAMDCSKLPDDLVEKRLFRLWYD